MYLPALLVTALALGVLIAVRGLQSPVRWLVTAYAFTLPFGASISIPAGLPHPYGTLSTLIGMATLAGLLLHLSLTNAFAPRLHPSLVGWILFLAVSALTFLWSADPADTLSALLLLTSLVVLHLLMCLVNVDLEDLQVVASGLIWGGAVTGLLALHALLTGSLVSPDASLPRFGTSGGAAAAGQGDANITAAVLILPLALAVSRAMQDTTALRRLASAAAAGAIVFALMLTGSRGGLLATAVALLALGWQYRPRWRLLVPLAVMAPVAWLAFSQAPQELQGHLQATHSSGRLGIWTVALEACESRCLLGGGWGTFADIYREASQTSNAGNANLEKLAHNSWLRALLETGIAGLLLLVSAAVVLIRDVIRLPPLQRGPPLAGLAALVVSNTFLSTINFKYFWMTLAYAVMVVNAHRRTQVDAPAIGEGARPVTGLHRLAWGAKHYWPALLGTVAVVMALFVAHGLRSWSRPVTYHASALLIADELNAPSWALPRLVFTVFHDEVLPETGRRERQTATVRLDPIANTVATWVRASGPSASEAQQLADATAGRLVTALHKSGELGSFLSKPAAVRQASSMGIPNLIDSLIGGTLAAIALGIGVVLGILWLRRPLTCSTDIASLSGLPILGVFGAPARGRRRKPEPGWLQGVAPLARQLSRWHVSSVAVVVVGPKSLSYSALREHLCRRRAGAVAFPKRVRTMEALIPIRTGDIDGPATSAGHRAAVSLLAVVEGSSANDLRSLLRETSSYREEFAGVVFVRAGTSPADVVRQLRTGTIAPPHG